MNTKYIMKRLKEYLGVKNQEEFAEVINIDINRVKNLEAGRSKKFKDEEILTITSISDITEEEIKLGKKIERELPPELLDLIEDYQTLSDDKKQEYSLKIKRDAIDEKLKGSEA